MKNQSAWKEIILYTIVGLTSTAVQYAAYAACYALTHNYVAANIVGFILSVFHSYYWNRRVVFHSQEDTVWWKVLMKNYALYFATGVVMTNLLSYLFIEKCHMSAYLSPLIIVVILYPVNYIINKYWAHKKERAS